MERCKVCGRTPAMTLTFRRHVGMLLLQRDFKAEAPLCRDHGVEVGRRYLKKTLAQGWWGIISFFWNFYDGFLDLSSLGKAKRLGPPVDAPAAAPGTAYPAQGQIQGMPAPQQWAPAQPPPAPGQQPPPPVPGQFTG